MRGIRPHRTVGAAAISIAAAVAVLSAGCSFGATSSSPPTTTVPAPVGETTTTTEAGRPTTTLEVIVVPGSPRSTTSLPAALGPGSAQINGTVVGPSGPVGGATVEVERGVGDSAVSTRLTTGPSGTFSLPSLLGGRYRVRAWALPDLAQPEATTFFLGDQESRSLQLAMVRFGSVNVRVSVDADPLPATEPANVAVLVYSGSINADGELVAAPIVGITATVEPGPRLRLLGADRVVTGGAGEATFRVQCREGGDSGGEVVVSGMRYPLGLPPCAAPPASG